MQEQESEKYEFLNQQKIINLFIGNGDFTSLSGNDIKGMGTQFGDKSFQNISSNFGPSRSTMMSNFLEYLHRNNLTSDFLTYFVFQTDIEKAANDLINSNINHQEAFGDSLVNGEKLVTNYDEAVNLLRQKFIDEINKLLIYSQCKLVIVSNSVYITDKDQISINDIAKDTKVVNDDYLKNMLSKAQKELDDGDFDTIVTKSKTLLEQTFMQILRNNDVPFDEKNGSIDKYREDVHKLLGMSNGRDWDSRVKKMISGMNKSFDAICEMRNKSSDSHGSFKRIDIGKAEANTIINLSVTLSHYYLSVESRQCK